MHLASHNYCVPICNKGHTRYKDFTNVEKRFLADIFQMMSQNLSLAPKLVYLIQKMKQDKVQAAHSALIFQRFFSLTTPLGLILKLGPHWMNGLVGEVCMLKDQIDRSGNCQEVGFFNCYICLFLAAPPPPNFCYLEKSCQPKGGFPWCNEEDIANQELWLA